MKANHRNRLRLSSGCGPERALLAPPSRAVGPGVAPPGAASRKTILVVDDHPVVRDLFGSFLRGLGYSVLEAGGGSEAQELAAGPMRVDLLVTDFRMPQMNGVQLARWFHQNIPQTKILVVSSTPWEVEPYFVKSDEFALLEKSEAFARLAGIVNELLAAPGNGLSPSASDSVSPRRSA